MNKEEINGIINVLKPPGMTSFDVVGYLRKKLKIKKISHTGTLDPGAVGVLPICVGKATKLIELLIDKDKCYRTEMKLGETTDTQDSYGTIISKKPILGIKSNEIEKVINSYVGEYKQIPPMYSAIKINGEKLYNLARKGIEVERTPRNVVIYNIDIINIKDEKIIFDVCCSKGTYIRTLCNDIGDQLGCGAHLTFLLRTKSGNFNLSDSYTLDEINEAVNKGLFNNLLCSMEDCLGHKEKITLDCTDEKRFKNGGFIKWGIENDKVDKNNIPMFNSEKKIIGLGEKIEKNGIIFVKPKRIF